MMDQDLMLKTQLSRIDPPEGDTVRAVRERLRTKARPKRRRLRPAAAVLLAALLLCGTAAALTLTGVVELTLGGPPIEHEGKVWNTQHQLHWTPARMLPLSDEQRDWMARRPWTAEGPYSFAEPLEALAPMLADAGLYHCPLLGAPMQYELDPATGRAVAGTECGSSCRTEDGCRVMWTNMRFQPENDFGQYCVGLDLTVVFDDGAAELPVLETGLAAEEQSEVVSGVYESPVSGVKARYAQTYWTERGNYSLDVYFVDGPALWRLRFTTVADGEAQLTLMRRLIDCLER